MKLESLVEEVEQHGDKNWDIEIVSSDLRVSVDLHYEDADGTEMDFDAMESTLEKSVEKISTDLNQWYAERRS